MNRLKGLELVNRVSEKLWTEVYNMVQEAVNKTVPKKNKSKKAKSLSEEALQVAKERREVKIKGEWEKYIQLDAEFLKIARRDKKAFFSEQYKEIEENNRSLQENWKHQRNISSKDGHNKGQQ